MKGNFAAVVLVVVGSFMLLTNLGIIDVSVRELLHTWWLVLLFGVGVALFFLPERIYKDLGLGGLALVCYCIYSCQRLYSLPSWPFLP